MGLAGHPAAVSAGVDGQVLQRAGRLANWANFVKVAHTVFALPFVVVGMAAASLHSHVDWARVAIAVTAFTAARFAAMGFNRIVDRHYDALNPRTSARELPAGRMTVREAWVLVVVMSVAFFALVAQLNPLCLRLAPLAWAWTLAYSFTKRFTALCHFWLGWSLAFAPAGGYLALSGEWTRPWWLMWVLGIGVSSWVGGFDILYSLQDEAFDREHRLRSLTVALGAHGAIWYARISHIVAVVALGMWGWSIGLGTAYLGAVVLAAVALIWEHRLVRAGDYSRLDVAFFSMNGVIAGVMMLGALVGALS
jgi:4-hydroxybenzoate polyprenyltransferase